MYVYTQPLQEKSERVISILIPDEYNSIVLSRSRLCDGRSRMLLEIAVFDAKAIRNPNVIQ